MSRSERVLDLASGPPAPRVPAPRVPPVPVAWVQGTLALDIAPQVEPPRPAGRVGTSGDVADLPAHDRAALDAFALRWMTAAVQIAMADRPVTQMLRNATPEVYADLAERSRVVLEAAGPARARIVRPVVLGVRTGLVRPDALEVSAHVRHGQRSRAVAARLEHLRGRWQGVAVTFG